MQKITPFLWFDHQAEEAAEFYCTLFKDSKINSVSRYGEAGPLPAGTALTVSFQLEGQEFVALNGGPQYSFSPAISFYVSCATQTEVDELWTKLTAGGEEEQCGWLRDKFGLSWQIIPTQLIEMISDPNPEKARRATEAMFTMKKIDIEGIRQAYTQG